MATEPITIAEHAEIDVEVHGRLVQSWYDTFSEMYIFLVNYLEIDPADDEACRFLERIGIIVRPNGTWRLVRRQRFKDSAVKILAVPLPESETSHRIQALLRATLDSVNMRSMLVRIISLSTPQEYMLYDEHGDVEAFNTAVSALFQD